jgi:hypothetical protein
MSWESYALNTNNGELPGASPSLPMMKLEHTSSLADRRQAPLMSYHGDTYTQSLHNKDNKNETFDQHI